MSFVDNGYISSEVGEKVPEKELLFSAEKLKLLRWGFVNNRSIVELNEDLYLWRHYPVTQTAIELISSLAYTAFSTAAAAIAYYKNLPVLLSLSAKVFTVVHLAHICSFTLFSVISAIAIKKALSIAYKLLKNPLRSLEEVKEKAVLDLIKQNNEESAKFRILKSKTDEISKKLQKNNETYLKNMEGSNRKDLSLKIQKNTECINQINLLLNQVMLAD